MSPNRIVAIYTPLVFAPLAGCVALWLADNFPGVDLDRSQLVWVFVAGMVVALVMGAQWVHGWQKWEARQAERQDLALRLATVEEPQRRRPVATATVAVEADLFDDGLEDEFEELEESDDFDEFDDLDDLDDLEPVTPDVNVGDRPPH